MNSLTAKVKNRLGSAWDLACEKARRLAPSHWLWIVAAMISGFIAYYLDSSALNKPTSGQVESPETASTSIPSGYVLVPIEISNYESLDSILGQYGLVDLYIPGDGQTKRSVKVASRLKILRAPLNPSHFAVLVRENESSQLVTHTGPYFVIVQNPKSSGTGFVSSPDSNEQIDLNPRAKKSRITVETMDDQES